MKTWSEMLAEKEIRKSKVYHVGAKFVYDGDGSDLPEGLSASMGNVLCLQRPHGISATQMPGTADDWIVIGGGSGGGSCNCGFTAALKAKLNAMPTILKGHDVRGKITRDIYRQCGLLPGTPVAIGGGDGACATRGAGVVEPGSAYTNMGSSAWVCQMSDHPILDPKARIFNWIDMNGEDYHVCGTVQCGAAAFDWCLKNLLGGHDATADISIVENMARQIAPGAEGVLFLPTLMGWRTPYWDPNTRGCLMGFSLYHDQRHIARAVYEGIAFALNACAEVMAECDAPVRSLMLTGGGARSGLWPDMIAAIFGLTTRVHRSPGETTSLGAAIASGVGVGLFNSYSDAAGMVSARSTHPVNPQWQQTYKKVYAIYADIYRQIKPLNDRIAGM